MIINTLKDENIFTYLSLAIILPFILFGGFLHIAVQIIFVVFSVVILYLSSENLEDLLYSEFKNWIIAIIFSSIISILLAHKIFGGFIFPSIGYIVGFCISIIIQIILSTFTLDVSETYICIRVLTVFLTFSALLLFFGGAISEIWIALFSVALPMVPFMLTFAVGDVLL